MTDAAPFHDPAPDHGPAPVHDPVALTRYIETRYHARHRQQLAALATLAEKVETVHFGDDDVPVGLCDLLERMAGEMEVYLKKEELILFPAIRNGETQSIENPVAMMRADHHDHAAEIAKIRDLTGGPAVPEGACSAWTTLYAGLSDFLSDLEEHLRLENDVLFAQFGGQ